MGGIDLKCVLAGIQERRRQGRPVSASGIYDAGRHSEQRKILSDGKPHLRSNTDFRSNYFGGSDVACVPQYAMHA